MAFNICMTSANRGRDTALSTIRSLRKVAKIPDLVHVFAEPMEDSLLSSITDRIEVHRNKSKLGVVVNSYWALRRMLTEYNSEEALPTIILQDDVSFCAGFAQKLEAGFAAGGKVLLGFTHEWNMKPEFNDFKADAEGWQIWIPSKSLQDTFGMNLQGALCVAFSDKALREIVYNQNLISHVIAAQTGDIPNRHWDNILFMACAKAGIPVSIHNPSLCEHEGVESTIYPGRAIRTRRGYHYKTNYPYDIGD
jgi:hypothetical protein